MLCAVAHHTRHVIPTRSHGCRATHHTARCKEMLYTHTHKNSHTRTHTHYTHALFLQDSQYFSTALSNRWKSFGSHSPCTNSYIVAAWRNNLMHSQTHSHTWRLPVNMLLVAFVKFNAQQVQKDKHKHSCYRFTAHSCTFGMKIIPCVIRLCPLLVSRWIESPPFHPHQLGAATITCPSLSNVSLTICHKCLFSLLFL
jgi:hypothetical protein